MRQQRKEDAVSPVIGVMLMLVVTIVIAAVITGFATDLSADTSTTPMALFEVDYVDTYGEMWDGKMRFLVKDFGIVHKGGDAVPLKDIQITYVTDSGASHGLLNILETSQISVIGKEEEGTNAVVTTGDIIKIEPYQDSDNSKIENGAGVTWTMSHTKTGGVIAKGEFIAIPM